MVLHWLSENGLSSETQGRPCDFVTPRSVSFRASVLLVIGRPLPAWILNWPGGTPCLAMVCWTSLLASSALSGGELAALGFGHDFGIGGGRGRGEDRVGSP